MDWMGLVGNFFGGGVVGTVVGGVLGLMTKDKELELAKINNAQALELRRLDISAATKAAELQMQAAAQAAVADAAKADLANLSVAMEADKAAYGDGPLGRVVDFLRGVIRPVITIGAFSVIVMFAIRAYQVGDQAQLVSLTNLCAVPIGYWFGSRFTGGARVA